MVDSQLLPSLMYSSLLFAFLMHATNFRAHVPEQIV